VIEKAIAIPVSRDFRRSRYNRVDEIAF